MYGDKMMPSQFREPVRRLDFPNYAGPGKKFFSFKTKSKNYNIFYVTKKVSSGIKQYFK